MKKNLLSLAGLATLALGLGSCAYDPFATGGSYTRSTVDVGYGHGYGYGGSTFRTSHFWTTGDPRWGYDPHLRIYYDHHRRCYYDPFLHGYYPVGYRPPILVGVPHPVGHRHGWCPPPRRFTNVTIVNYRNREAAYRNTSYGWARNVRYDGRHRAGRDGFPGRNLDRNAAGTDPRFIQGPSRDPRRGPEARRFAGGRPIDGGNWQRRPAEPRPQFGPAPAPGRAERELPARSGGRMPAAGPGMGRDGGERRGWNGRGNSGATDARPRIERPVPAGRTWAGRQPQPAPAMSRGAAGRGTFQRADRNASAPQASGVRWQRSPTGNAGADSRFVGRQRGGARNNAAP